MTGLAAAVQIERAESSSDLLVVNGLGGGDLVGVDGSPAGDTIQIAPSPLAGNARVTASNIPAAVDVAGAATLAVNGLAGDDAISGSNGLAALLSLQLDGGSGGDVINGGDGNDAIIGGPQSDTVDGNRGIDVGVLGFGDDAFIWDPGDGSDVVEGDGGADVLIFNGNDVNESFDLSANGERLRFFRNVGGITMDVDNVERVDLEALGGADSAVVNDLAGTDVTRVNVDLEGVLGGGAGDGQPDTVTVNGTPAPDTINVAAYAGAVNVTGLAAAVQITHSEAINDQLTVNGLDGDDTIAAGPGVDALIQLTANQ